MHRLCCTLVLNEWSVTILSAGPGDFGRVWQAAYILGLASVPLSEVGHLDMDGSDKMGSLHLRASPLCMAYKLYVLVAERETMTCNGYIELEFQQHPLKDYQFRICGVQRLLLYGAIFQESAF